MVRLLTAASPMEARIIAARLGAEGIVWDFRGSVDGPLAVGPVEVLVDEEGLETARELIQVDDPEWSFARSGTPAHETTAKDVLWVALVVLAIVLFALARMTSRV